jgi:hypothetical protein
LARHWDEAQGLYSALAEQSAVFKKLCAIYLQRIARYRSEQLPDDWCGVWQHDSK